MIRRQRGPSQDDIIEAFKRFHQDHGKVPTVTDVWKSKDYFSFTSATVQDRFGKLKKG